MNACARQNEVTNAVRAGQWPQGIAEELRSHVSGCARCTEEAHMLRAFAVAREGAMRLMEPQSASLLWWKAQLRRRREAMERLERPGTISTATIAGSIILLLAVLVIAFRRVNWSRWLAVISHPGWNAWIVGSIAVMLLGFALVAIFASFGFSDERH